MPKLSLNKSALHKERRQLALYKKVLPSLDLKRRQLIRETGVARQKLQQSETAIETFAAETAHKYPMLAHQKIGHGDLIRIRHVAIGSENVVGTRLPVLDDVMFEPVRYPLLGKPAWTEMLILRIQDAVKMEIEKEVLRHRIAVLEFALTKITQRVNLFEKVLIPGTEEKIKKIAVLLEDLQRASVVRSKIAKSKHRGGAA